MMAGVESRIVPNGCDRTILMTFWASGTLVRFISGISVAAFATVKAIMVPSAVVVYRLRSVVARAAHGPDVAVPGAHAVQSGVPSCWNFQPVGCVASATGL